jgi:hypothetical protein
VGEPAPGGGAGPLPTSLTLDRAAERFGAYRWAEHRLFELTGAWAAEATSPAARIHLDVVSGQHSWHAELWAARLPVLDGTDPEALTRPAGPVMAGLFDELARARGTVDRLAGLYRVVVPRLLVTYGRHLRRAAPAADAPAVRALRLVRRDEVESWEAGEALLEHLVVGDGEAAAAAAVQARLEAGLVASWAGCGLLPWPDAAAPGGVAAGGPEPPSGHDT